jgi:hypothetical protein
VLAEAPRNYFCFWRRNQEISPFFFWRSIQEASFFEAEKPRNIRAPGSEKLGFCAFVCLAREWVGRERERESVRGRRWRSGACNRVRTSNSSCVADANIKGCLKVWILFYLSLLWIFYWMWGGSVSENVHSRQVGWRLVHWRIPRTNLLTRKRNFFSFALQMSSSLESFRMKKSDSCERLFMKHSGTFWPVVVYPVLEKLTPVS